MKPFPLNDWFDRIFFEFIDMTREKAHKFFEQYYDIQRVPTPFLPFLLIQGITPPKILGVVERRQSDILSIGGGEPVA